MPYARSETRVYEWFQEGREDVSERPGHPSASRIDENVEKVKEMFMNDRRVPIQEVYDDAGILIYWFMFYYFEQKQQRMEFA
nr:unnamed protein product [Callosobruchus chinensis]